MRRIAFLMMLTIAALMFPRGIADVSGSGYPARALHLPAAGLTVDVPSDMEGAEGDEEAFDRGFRFNGCSDTFDLTVYVHETRDLAPEGYAAFRAKRTAMQAKAERVNGFAVWRLTKPDRPYDFTLLVMAPDQNLPDVANELAFLCDGEADRALTDEIVGTLRLSE